jgi:hypothetical protein
MKKMTLGIVAVLGVFVGAGCIQALVVPAAVGGAVYVDRKMCEKQGIEPAKVNPELIELINKLPGSDGKPETIIEPEEVKPEPAVEEKVSVFVIGEGDKYHKKDCRFVVNTSKEIKEVPLEDAKASGLKACKVCKP